MLHKNITLGWYERIWIEILFVSLTFPYFIISISIITDYFPFLEVSGGHLGGHILLTFSCRFECGA